MQEQVWKILLVENNNTLHTAIEAAAKNIYINNKRLYLFHTKNIDEAKSLLQEHSDIAVTFIDISMQTPSLELELVSYIRNDLHNRLTRIILLASKEAQTMPPEEIIERYDINDYKEYDEISERKLFNVIRTV